MATSLLHPPLLPPQPKVEDHEFYAFAESGSFHGMKGAGGLTKKREGKVCYTPTRVRGWRPAYC
jgi:hypothetical protein